jgi:polyketide cyclase/dehydrase/lipid transport protein
VDRAVTTRIHAYVDIAAPVEEVFTFFDDLANAPLLNPRVVEITTVEPLGNGGRRIEYSTRGRSGAPVAATSEHVEYVRPWRTVTRTEQSGVTTLSTREFEALAEGARVVATIEWTAPVRYIARVVEFPLRRPLRDSLHLGLAAAKQALEAG